MSMRAMLGFSSTEYSLMLLLELLNHRILADSLLIGVMMTKYSSMIALRLRVPGSCDDGPCRRADTID